ncbi:MAG TPA: tRNA (N6-isopentenyl adenosine(37)-C2)-methylthiotransferase MiaB, partial [Bacillota bacterium]|nr:tRNA (N6-isopentenyl adenosine(37)-C2)-methylthiotransferase MiaB [Bacillota bacterium]
MGQYFITTFGCQMNVHDSEVLAGMLESLEYTAAASPEAADLILLNTCCVRENAENRTFGHIGNLKVLKEQKPGLVIGVCGCMAQEPTEVEKIKTKFPWVDLVFGTHNLHELPELLKQVSETHSQVIEVWDHDGTIREGLPVKRTDRFRAWVTIMYGCNNFCAYCIVPYVRGRERSRAPEVVIDEIRDLVRDGVREVTLLGQNVNSYGQDLPESERIRNFAGLLREIAKGTGIRRIRFQTSHPKDLSAELIEVMAEEPNICHHLHLPIQAGSSRVLQLMNRRYTKEGYLELVARLKARIPDIALTTDIIAGFPGELE